MFNFEEKARILGREELLGLSIGAVVWRESRWTDEDDGTEHAELEPEMRSVCCGEPCLVDGASQTMIKTVNLGPDEDGFQERYWSARPTEERRMTEPWEGVSGE